MLVTLLIEMKSNFRRSLLGISLLLAHLFLAPNAVGLGGPLQATLQKNIISTSEAERPKVKPNSELQFEMGIADLAVLLEISGGTGRVRVQSGSDGAFVRNLIYTVVDNPVGLTVLPKYNVNSFDDLAVLGENAGVRHVQILDTNSGMQVNRIDYP